MGVTSTRLIVAPIFGAAAAAIIFAVGVPLPFAISWGMLVAGFVIALAMMGAGTADEDPDAQLPTSQHSTSEVGRLAWSLNSRDGSAGALAMNRLRRYARRRIARAGHDIDDAAQHDAIDALAGMELTAALQAQALTLAQYEAVLIRLEALAPDHGRNPR